jgi:hypothetical protein
MAKKKSRSSRGSIGSAIVDLVSSGIKKIASSVEEEIRAKQKLQHYFTSWVIMGAALFIIFYGIAMMIDFFLPGWVPGLSFIIVGIVFILVALVYRKYY